MEKTRRNLAWLLLCSMLLGCQRAALLPVSTQQSLPSPFVTPLQADTDASQAPVPDAHPASVRFLGERQSEAVAEPLIREVTLRAFDWSSADASGNYPTTYRQASLDFAELNLTLLSLTADETHTELSFRVAHPQSWSMEESQNMNGWFLHFAVLLDGEQAKFTTTGKSVQLGCDTHTERCDDYVVKMVSEEVDQHTLASHQTLSVEPFVLTYTWIPQGRYWQAGEDGADVALTLTRPHTLQPHRAALPTRAVTLELAPLCAGVAPEPAAVSSPALYTVTMSHEDVERLLSEGFYEKEGRYPWWGFYQNEQLDFSELAIFVDRFTVWDLGVQYHVRVQLPSSWTNRQKWMLLSGSALQIALYVDGAKVSRDDLFSQCTLEPCPIERTLEAYQAFTCDALYLDCYANRDFADRLLNAQEICFVPVVLHYTSARVDGILYRLDETSTPYGDLFDVEVIEYTLEPLWDLAEYVQPDTLLLQREDGAL